GFAGRETAASFPACLVPVLNQVDARDDVDDLTVLDGEDAGVACEQQAIGFVEVNGGLNRGQRAGHDLVDGYFGRIAVIVQHTRERDLLHAADRLAGVEHGKL